jgi:hypothetical protein
MTHKVLQVKCTVSSFQFKNWSNQHTTINKNHRSTVRGLSGIHLVLSLVECLNFSRYPDPNNSGANHHDRL